MNLSESFMARRNGRSEVESELDVEHELPETSTADNAGVAGEVLQPEGSRDAELVKLRAERDALVDRLARSQAEFDNARKRAVREQQDFRDYALMDALKTLLPVVDSFERALQVSAGEKSEMRNGVELIYKQLQDVFTKLGLKQIPALGEQFDPHLHEGIEMVETREFPDHQVIEELQRGYKLKDRLLRPAMVKVAQNSKH
jgi:molecular chaperone GrpE